VHNTLAVPDTLRAERVATLWQLSWISQETPPAVEPGSGHVELESMADSEPHVTVVECCVYRNGSGLELRVESATAVIVCEPFDFRPRALARVQALRQSLKRRGWLERTALTSSAGAGDLERV
jgi:hypothetical protein